MPRYRSFGGLDDSTVEDGDVGFVGVDARNPPWQLPAGYLTLSENGRIDGDWTARKGADVVAEGSLSDGLPLRLPFWLVDTAGGDAVTAASRLDDTVTLTVPGHGFPVGGDSSASVIVNPTGSDNSVLFTADLSGSSGSGISIKYTAGAANSVTNIVSCVDEAIEVLIGDRSLMTVTGTLSPAETGAYQIAITTPPYAYVREGFIFGDFAILKRNLGDVGPFPPGESGNVWIIGGEWEPGKYYGWRQVGNVEYQFPSDVPSWDPFVEIGFGSPSLPTGTPTVTASYPSGQQIINAINLDVVSSALVTASASGTVTGPVAPVGPVYLQGGSGGSAYLGLEDVTGAPTVDPNGVWRMTPTDADTLTFDIPGSPVGAESYTVTSATVRSVLDDEASDFVYGSCLFSDPGSDNDESIFLAFGTDVKRVSLSDGSITDYGLPGSETIDEPCDMIQAMDKVFIFRSGKVAFQWQVGDTDFSEVADGAYTQPQVFTVTGTFVDVVSGLCTITGLTNNTVSEGDEILIYDSTDPNFEPFKGERYLVTAANGTSFSFYIPVQDLSTISTNTLSLGRQVSIGGGFIHQPAFPWAIYFQRRIWGPYWFSGDPFVDRDIRDELIASDVLDPDTYDPVYNQFRITAGIADYIVALHPFYDDALLVLNRNSLHGVFGTRGSLADTSVRELTREIGCMARKSVVSQGGNVFFLSDSGVYGLQFFNDYNLRGVEKPLSEMIEPYMDRLSATLAVDSVGIYFNNRYWLAVPLDSSPGAGDATGNNAILVYNLMNNAWESVDTFGDPAFLISNLIIGRAEERNDLYAVTSAGGIHVLDKNDSDYDILATNFVAGSAQFEIPAVMRTRAYMGQTSERKRFIMMGCQMRAGNAQSDVGLAFSAEDPDNTGSETLVSTTMNGPLPPMDTADVRQRIGGVRGFNGQITLRREIGRPSIRSTKIQATVTNRETITQK